jgi:hypothetical protein
VKDRIRERYATQADGLSFGHLLSNTVPFVILGAAIASAG